MQDTIYRQAAIDAFKKELTVGESKGNYVTICSAVGYEGAKQILESIPSAQPEQHWIPVKWHDCTDEDREKYGFSNDIVAVFDNEMPDDNQEILITTSYGSVEKDVCYIDEGFSLDSGWNWIDDVKAWMPLPEEYKGED